MGPEWRELRSEGSPLARTIKLLPPHYPQVRTVRIDVYDLGHFAAENSFVERIQFDTKPSSFCIPGSERSLRCQREIDEE